MDETTRLTIAPQSPTIGAEVGGIDLGGDLTAAEIDEIRQALLRWKVLIFREQDLTTEQHLAFGSHFGELEVHPFAKSKPGHDEVLVLHHNEENTGGENIWHSDVTWRQEPSLGSVLRMIEAPAVGGDTVFADMSAAYDGLPDDIKAEITGRTARHDFSGFRARAKARGASDAELAEFDRLYPHPHHPVVRTHPETGRRSLYVNRAFTREIDDMDPDRSAELLDILYRQATFPEYQTRITWRPNTVIFWDNRSAQHYAVSDYFPNTRRAERVTVVGDAPYFDADQPVTMEQPSPFRGVITHLAGK